MRLILKKNLLKENSVQFMRRAGYNFIKGIVGEEMSFDRALAAGGWPRFHAYLKEDGETITINLHLDQKRPSYEGAAAHNAEYDGDLTKAEIERIKNLI
jgi:hypothetical protein